MGMEVRTPEQLAALGLYPVRREPLEPGASGYGEMTLIGNEFVIPSLPGDPDAVHERYLDGLSCTKRQGMLELAHRGLIAQIEALIEAGTLEDQIWYAHEDTWRFRDPRVQAIGTELALDESALIEMFEAAKLR
jgi:hypothetical protein